MKKLIFIAMCAVAAFGTSCSDALNIDPSDRFSEAQVWSSEETLDTYVGRFYVIFRNNAEFFPRSGSSPWLSDTFSDILKSTSWDNYLHPYNKALLDPTNFNADSAGPFDCWDNYTRIREVNEFLVDAPVSGAKFDSEWLDIRKAEARFARAYAYYLLCRVYGGVILRTDESGLDGPAQNDKARSSEADCWNFVISELQAIAPTLPASWDNANVGRATKKAAYALLSRVALHAQKWDVAVTAADEVAKLGVGLLDNYADVFTAGVNNAEICFGVNFNAGVIGHSYDVYVRPKGDKNNVLSAFCPTGELADEYEMSDGTPFSWEEHGDNPYTGRDPRFYATILYNGARWMGRDIETFVDGSDGFEAWTASTGQKNTTVSGYYLRKYLRDDNTSWATAGASSQYWILIRYAEVLLNKAEALAEQNWSANSVQALAALNEVRQRTSVSLPERATADKEQFMEWIRHERVAELAGEGLRYWDLRRWRLAVEVINGKAAHGVKITKSGDVYNYEHVEIDGGLKRVFYDRFYHFAIPLSERSSNPLCDNNEGWI